MFKKKIIKSIFISIIILGSFFISTLLANNDVNNYIFKENLISYNQNKVKQSIELFDKKVLNKNINSIEALSLPRDISFVFVSMDTLIPENPTLFPKKFQDFYYKLLNESSWINIGSRNYDFSKALRKIHLWYLDKFNTPHYAGPFPIKAKQLVVSTLEEHKPDNLSSQFKKINNIPEDSKELYQGTKFQYIFPRVLNVLDANYSSTMQTRFPNLNKFDYKMISINTNDLNDDYDSFLDLQYSYNDGDKYNIYIRNKNNELANQENSIENLIKEGCIIIRKNNKKYEIGNTPIDLRSLNISIVKTNDKVEFFTSIRSFHDYATLTINNNLKDNWKDIVEIGLLDYPISPKNVSNVIREGKAYNMIPSNAFNNLLGYSEKTDHTINPSGTINDKSLKTFSIKFYMSKNEKITIPIFYRNQQIEGSSNIILETNDKGEILVNKNTLKIPSDDYKEEIEPIEIKHRKEVSNTGKIWTEVEIITDSNVIAGAKDIRSTSSDLVPSEFKLKYYGAIQRDIIFEKPLIFLDDYKKIYIKYAKIFDSEKVTKKMIGELYYSAWGVYEPKFNIMRMTNDIKIPSLVMPIFQNKKLSYFISKAKIFSSKEMPINNDKIVKNNFGKTIQDINNYYNKLNSIIKAITGYNISLLKGQDFLKPTNEIQEYKFVTNMLIGKDINDATRQALRELKVATNAFVNGVDSLLEQSKKIVNIMTVRKNDRESWARFALPRIIEIIKNRYSSVFSEFKNALSQYKYNMILKLLTSNVLNYNGKFIGIHSRIITKKMMQIGSKKQNMNILENIPKSSKNFTNFKNQLKSILNFIKQKPKTIKKILGKKDFESFIKNSNLLLKNEETLSNNKKDVLMQSELLFKILDFYIREKKYSLQGILTISNFIENERKRIQILVNNFNSAAVNLLKSKKIHVSAYAFKELVEDKFIEVAEGNVKKIFDSFLNKSNLSKKEIKAISYYKNYDYIKEPNKLFEIAVKIGEFNFKKFLDDITKKDVLGVANKILNLDPLVELPSNLPAKSRFTDVIKNMSNEPKIIYIILGAITSLSGIMVALIGFVNRNIMGSKTRIIISLGLIAIGMLTLLVIFVFPSIGNLSLIAN